MKIATVFFDWGKCLALAAVLVALGWAGAPTLAQPLVVGRAQFVFAQLPNGDKWDWHLPLDLKPQGNLLAISPTGVIPQGAAAHFGPSALSAVDPLDEKRQLISLELSYRDNASIKDSGSLVWGYFAQSRFVQAKVKEAVTGIDGTAHIELPGGGGDSLQSLKQSNAAEQGQQIAAFDYGAVAASVDHVVSRDSTDADYYIEFTYSLRSSEPNLRVAEGQPMVVYDSQSHVLTRKKAYQLKVGENLIQGFSSDGPIPAPIVGIKGTPVQSFPAYKLKLEQLPLARANGILIPTETEPTFVSIGIKSDSRIQTAPDPSVLAAAQVSLGSGDVPTLDLRAVPPVAAADVNKGTAILSFIPGSSPHRFFPLQSAGQEKKEFQRYIILDAKLPLGGTTELVCGQVQEVYATQGDSLDQLGLVKAESIEQSLKQSPKQRWNVCALDGPPKHTKPVLASITKAVLFSDPSPVDFRILLVTDGSALRQNKRDKHAHLPLQPCAFANRILVQLRLTQPDPETVDLGGEGNNVGQNVVPAEHESQTLQAGTGVVWDNPPPNSIAKFDADDLRDYQTNLKNLQSAFAGVSSVRPATDISGFVSQYFQSYDMGRVCSSVPDFLNNYLNARDVYISTGREDLLPALVNEEVFLGTLLYACSDSQSKAAGDALLRDTTCIELCTLTKDGGKAVINMSGSRVAAGLLAQRDMLAFLRKGGNGFADVSSVEVPPDSTLTRSLDMLIADGVHQDVKTASGINMYNLCSQLNHWAGCDGTFADSVLAPQLQRGNLFSTDLSNRLGFDRR